MLFGSRAKGTAQEFSDFDILIVIDQYLPPDKKIPVRTKIRKELLQNGIRSDILIQSRAEVDRKKKLPGHLIRFQKNFPEF